MSLHKENMTEILQKRQNPLISVFGARSQLKQALEPEVPRSRDIGDVKPKKSKPKPSKPKEPDVLPTREVTSYVNRARGLLAEMVEQMEQYEAKLNALDADELEELLTQKDIKERQEKRLKALEETSHLVDFDLWIKFPTWSVDEFTALKLNKDPKRISYKDIKPFEEQSDFARQYTAVYDLAYRSFTPDDTALFSPLMFIRWAGRIDLKLPSALKQGVLENKSFYSETHKPSEPLMLYGGLQNQEDAKAYMRLAAAEPKVFARKYRDAAKQLAMHDKKKRNVYAILTSMRRGLGLQNTQ